MNEEVESYIRYVREHWPECIEGLTDPAEIGKIGKRLVSIATSGPRLWAGQNILRELGVFAEYEPRKRPDLSLSGRRQTL